MAASFVLNGEPLVLPGYEDKIGAYFYAKWDEAIESSGYPLDHEPLMTTFNYVDCEVGAVFQLDVSKLTSSRFSNWMILQVDPFLCISTHLILVEKMLWSET